MPARFHGMIEHFQLRDDLAECNDCPWKAEWPSIGRYEPPSKLSARARTHADAEGHQVTVRRVQFVRYTGSPT